MDTYIFFFCRRYLNWSWWYKSEKSKEKFLHSVWSRTSGQVNSIEQVEKHMKKWIKKQEEISKTRNKIKKWKEAKKNTEAIISQQVRKGQKLPNEKEKSVCQRKTKTELENENYRKRNKAKLEEWKEIKQIKNRLEESTGIIKSFSSRQEPKPKIVYDISKINPMPHHSLSLHRQNAVQKKRKENVNLDFLSFVQTEANSALIKSFQERDRQMIKEKKERSNNGHTKARKSFEDIHPFRSNQSRFNSSQFLTSSMIDLSSYNNQTKSSHAKIAHLTNPNTRPTTANVYSETRSTHLMQIEHVPRLRTPAWRTIS